MLSKTEGKVIEVKKILVEVFPQIFSNPNRVLKDVGWYNMNVTNQDFEIFRGHSMIPLVAEPSVIVPKYKGLPFDYR